MNSYVILMRGINVGGKNKISMAELRLCLGELGFTDVATYIQSGNVVLRSKLDAKATARAIEEALPKKFKLDSSLIKVLALDQKAFDLVVKQAPKEFGKDNSYYRYYVLFPMGPDAAEVMKDIEVREGVDAAWAGDYAIYFRLPSLTNPNKYKSHLNKITQKPVYKSITIRNWATTQKLYEMLEAL